jgi:cobalt/nickel transport system permease protein
MAIILGPWAAVIGVSSALLIQALFFGDGGILAFGANAFNMAVVIPFIGYWIYRLIVQSAPMESSKHWIGAAVGGYVGINAAALLAAVEFGLQPLLFHTANGTPLYCPYNLSQTIPAMMLAHMTVAGLAEAIVTAGVLVFLKKSMPEVLTGIAKEAKI